MTSSILVVEDQPDILKGLTINLENEGFRVLQADSGEIGISLALSQKPDLMLLDIMLPGNSGLDVCKHLRQSGFGAPIIFLTARSEPIDVVLGLELGADDYVTKPFNLRELIARIRSRLRDHNGGSPSMSNALKEYRSGSLIIDFDGQCATRAGQELNLTHREFEILRLLVANRNKVISRDQMLNEIWGYDVYPTTRTVDMHIAKLRQKVEDDPTTPKLILSVYGSGYKFAGG